MVICEWCNEEFEDHEVTTKNGVTWCHVCNEYVNKKSGIKD